jgi:site-specific DNA recombinase
MNDLSYFYKFTQKNDIKTIINYEVWSYSRVSSKEQFEKHSSVTRQIEANRSYAAAYKYNITQEFGGTYESAKSDFTRKEFKRLIDKIKSTRKKPYAVLVYKMSRFSRSGGNAIGLVNMLVEEMGVHLVETCSGLSTTTERGKAAIYESLFHAYKENLEKKEIVIPSMQAYLRNGNRLGVCPPGYDHYGPKVKNEQFLAHEQRLVINKNGELLRDAWRWKLSGLYSDAQILKKLAMHGFKLTAQKLSVIWRNPFYCGVVVNKMIDQPVAGNWEPLISKADFIRVQELLENRPAYVHQKEEELRPLVQFLRCGGCESFLVGHRVKKKDLHYYRCLKCAGYNLNAQTTKRAKRIGASDLFIEFLKNYTLPHSIQPLIRLGLTRLFNHYYTQNHQKDDQLNNHYLGLEKKLKHLKIRHGLGEIDQETYELTAEYLNAELLIVSKELNTRTEQISNLEKLLDQSLEMLANISKIWSSSEYEIKRRIQKTLFPDGIIYDAKKHQYRTNKTNSFVELTSWCRADYSTKKSENFQSEIENSRSVPRTGIEPALPCENQILSLTRLPIPPSGLIL